MSSTRSTSRNDLLRLRVLLRAELLLALRDHDLLVVVALNAGLLGLRDLLVEQLLELRLGQRAREHLAVDEERRRRTNAEHFELAHVLLDELLALLAVHVGGELRRIETDFLRDREDVVLLHRAGFLAARLRVRRERLLPEHLLERDVLA